MKSFLPVGYESLRTEKAYWKMKEMKDGDNRLRIVMPPICGWLDWEDRKPVRYRPDQKPIKSWDPETPIKPFWAMYVWDYAREGLFILEISQSSLLKALTSLATDADWGDFTEYDVKINKSGTGKETRYLLTPCKPSTLGSRITAAMEASPVRLAALYDNGDPWTDLNGDNAVATPQNAIGTPLEMLREYLVVDGIDDAGLENYLAQLAATKSQDVEHIVSSALNPQLLPKFKAAYLKYLGLRQAA